MAALLRGILTDELITKQQAMSIPSVASCVTYITNTISSIPVKLYKQEKGKTIEICDDRRLDILNKDTQDTLTAKQFWKAIITDYLVSKGGYAYINKDGVGNFISLNYVESSRISILKNTDPVFKSYDIYCNGEKYTPFKFFKVIQNTTDGMTGKSVIERNNAVFSIMYYSMVFEKKVYKSGGRRKGLLIRDKDSNQLSEKALTALKESWNNLYSSNSENAVVLPAGMKFQEITDSLKDMEINDSKEINSILTSMLFCVPNNLIWGKGTKEDNSNYIKYCIMPIINDIESSLDRDLLTEKEKNSGFYFAFDTREIMRGDIEGRYNAYKVGIETGFITRNEARNMEDLANVDGLDVISYNLANVLYDPNTKTYFTPNTKQVVAKNGTDLKGGEEEHEG